MLGVAVLLAESGTPDLRTLRPAALAGLILDEADAPSLILEAVVLPAAVPALVRCGTGSDRVLTNAESTVDDDCEDVTRL